MSGIPGLILSASAIVCAFYFFEEINCEQTDYFKEEQICVPCRDEVDKFCSECDNKDSCTVCDSGYYVDSNKLCGSCEVIDPNSKTCDAT